MLYYLKIITMCKPILCTPIRYNVQTKAILGTSMLIIYIRATIIHTSIISVTSGVKLHMQSRQNVPPSQKRGKDGLEDLKIMLYILRDETLYVAIVTESYISVAGFVQMKFALTYAVRATGSNFSLSEFKMPRARHFFHILLQFLL